MFTDEPPLDARERIGQRGIRSFAKQVTPETLIEAAKRTGVTLVKSPL